VIKLMVTFPIPPKIPSKRYSALYDALCSTGLGNLPYRVTISYLTHGERPPLELRPEVVKYLDEELERLINYVKEKGILLSFVQRLEDQRSIKLSIWHPDLDTSSQLFEKEVIIKDYEQFTQIDNQSVVVMYLFSEFNILKGGGFFSTPMSVVEKIRQLALQRLQHMNYAIIEKLVEEVGRSIEERLDEIAEKSVKNIVSKIWGRGSTSKDKLKKLGIDKGDLIKIITESIYPTFYEMFFGGELTASLTREETETSAFRISNIRKDLKTARYEYIDVLPSVQNWMTGTLCDTREKLSVSFRLPIVYDISIPFHPAVVAVIDSLSVRHRESRRFKYMLFVSRTVMSNDSLKQILQLISSFIGRELNGLNHSLVSNYNISLVEAIFATKPVLTISGIPRTVLREQLTVDADFEKFFEQVDKQAEQLKNIG